MSFPLCKIFWKWYKWYFLLTFVRCTWIMCVCLFCFLENKAYVWSFIEKRIITCSFAVQCNMTPVGCCCAGCSDAGSLLWPRCGSALLVLNGLVWHWFALQCRIAGVGVVWVFPERAGAGAEDESAARQEGSAQQREPTAGAAETRLRRMPVLALVRHLTLVYTCRQRARESDSQTLQSGSTACLCNHRAFYCHQWMECKLSFWICSNVVIYTERTSTS